MGGRIYASGPRTETLAFSEIVRYGSTWREGVSIRPVSLNEPLQADFTTGSFVFYNTTSFCVI